MLVPYSKKLTVHELIEAAKDLRSDGSNPEYDRALAEMVGDLIGYPEEKYRSEIRDLLGLERSL